MNTFATMEDQDLARLARDNHDAFDVLYRRHVTAVYRYCYARTDNVTDAEDLTAQTFLAALENIRRYRGRGNFAAWLFGIARRKCADFHRASYADRSDPIEDVDDAVGGESKEPETQALLSEMLDCVERMLAYLSPDRLEALHLRYWGGLSMRDIADVLQRGEAAVKMLVSRAISDLRERCVS